MPHDYSQLDADYPMVIALMPPVFTSHEFILRLGQRNQPAYIAALNAYAGGAAPFRTLHAELSRRLYGHGQLVRYLGEVPSKDIFGDAARCAQWERI
jgi:hypothetical protein